MKIGLYTNIQKDSDLSVTKKAVEALDGSFEVYVHSDIAKSFEGRKTFSEAKDAKKTALDIMLTVGGDGTILRIAKYCAENKIPILGINMGILGFLAEVEPADIRQIAARLKNKEYSEEKRSMLEVSALEDSKFIALNEVALKGAGSRMIAIDVLVGGSFADKIYCDGYIVATPTGSTAYSLSAGGPILSPKAKAFALTPINPHSLHSRALVIDDGEEVTLELCDNTAFKQKASVIMDGETVAAIRGGEKISVKKSKTAVSFIRFNDINFFNKLLSKLNSWGVTK